MNTISVMDRACTTLNDEGLFNPGDDLCKARAAVAELIEADREQDETRNALIDLNRHIAEKGWIDVEFDALRKACDRFVKAQLRRDRALTNVGHKS